MSVLSTIENIKIPYPTEGVIRTAQLNDTVAPENSVQLAVNMNFDQVGAIQTRLGITEYAPDLASEVKNYGTLRNAITPAGYTQLFQIGENNELSTTFTDPAAIKVSDTKIAVFWSGVDNDGFCQNFETDIATGAMTPLGTALEFETTNARQIQAITVTPSIVLVVWRGASNDGFVQCFDVSGPSIVALSTALEFDVADASDPSLAQIDANHFICFYAGPTGDGIATVFEVNLGTGAVTEPGASLTFDSGSISDNACCPLGDGVRFMNSWDTGAGARLQTFLVNTGTWAITALSTALAYSTVGNNATLLPVGDGQRFVNVYEGGSPSGKWAQVFSVNLTTYAITSVGTGIRFSTIAGNDTFALSYGNGLNFIAFYSKNVGDGFVQMLQMDNATSNMSVVGPELSGYDFANGAYTTGVVMAPTKVFAIWGNVSGNDGKSAMFQSWGDTVSGRWLYAGHGTEVSNLPVAGVWTSRRTGLATVSKPRFAQYLGYIWMVNGNDSIGGDPVATSNGGAFGADLVPTNFPAGDFISAGFEGRVWVADKTQGIIYYTDIVQFVPPFTYSLTYDPNVNYITTIAPQTGQQMTALYRVPRALLVFTEDNIYRIYGATSLDAYPAYNVGTYSQESIVETKTGIFFHHSSGFYQFDYGSQPVEISRRVIDFVKAIPRSAYENIKGVFDGFDAIEWSVGQVVVEGVVFSNCVMRYTISTQVWTIYDYPGNVISAMIYYDDGVAINHLVGTSAGKTGALDTGLTDFGQPFYYEYITRWTSYTDMYCQIKSLSGLSVYSENAAGANLSYQPQKAGPNVWVPILSVDERTTSLDENSLTGDFDVMRFRLSGNTRGAQIKVYGIEITTLTIKGYSSTDA